MKPFPHKINKLRTKLEAAYRDKHGLRYDTIKAGVKLLNEGGDLKAFIEEHENKCEVRVKKIRKIMALLIKKHRHETIGLSIGGRDCDGYDWHRMSLFEAEEHSCPYWKAVKDARGAIDWADGPTSYSFCTKEDHDKFHAENDPSKPVGRCGWDDDSQEPWTREEMSEWDNYLATTGK